MSTNRIGTMGVMVCRALGTPPIAEKEFLGKLSTTARKLGIHVFVFSPENSADESNNGSSSTTVQGYHYTKANGWIAGEYAVPDMVYDRCLHLNSKASANAANLLHRWKQHGTILWARGLPGKQRVHHVLKRSPIMRAYLPATLHYSGDESLRKALLAFRGSIFMKPSGGSHGRHTLQIQSLDHHTVSLQGRDRSNQMFQLTLPATEIYGWVQTFTNKRSFIIQPFLKLVSQDGSPFDIRSLVQKDERGTWSITGLAVRQGSNQGLTSNLHGGGTAYPAQPYLSAQYGEETAMKIIKTVYDVSALLPSLLEESFGRLGELGIDFGVDPTGRVWLLEVNSKPGRQAFALAGDTRAARLAIEHPIRYARYLLLRQLRRVNT